MHTNILYKEFPSFSVYFFQIIIMGRFREKANFCWAIVAILFGKFFLHLLTVFAQLAHILNFSPSTAVQCFRRLRSLWTSVQPSSGGAVPSSNLPSHRDGRPPGDSSPLSSTLSTSPSRGGAPTNGNLEYQQGTSRREGGTPSPSSSSSCSGDKDL